MPDLKNYPVNSPVNSLIDLNRGPSRDAIPENFTTLEQFEIRKLKDDYAIWKLVRYMLNTDDEDEKQVPSFSAINSLLSSKAIIPTSIAFAPILPYPATEFDSINTCMINFQDMLRQKKLPYGAFWCDENVYRIEKELQLLFTPKFDNLFIGIG